MISLDYFTPELILYIKSFFHFIVNQFKNFYFNDRLFLNRWLFPFLQSSYLVLLWCPDFLHFISDLINFLSSIVRILTETKIIIFLFYLIYF